MTYTPDYTVFTPAGVPAHFLFNTWAFKRFCEQQKIEYSYLLRRALATVDPTQETEVKPFMHSDLEWLLLAGHESFCRYNNQPFEANDLTQAEWIDGMGGFVSGRNEIDKFIVIVIARLMNVPMT